MSRPFFNKSRIEGYAADVENALWPELDHANIDGALHAAIHKDSVAYKSGLTNGEHYVAVIQALASMQQRAITTLAALQVENGDFDDKDDDELAA